LKRAAKVFRFERNELDVESYELRRAGRRLRLSRIPMEFLILLVEQRGKLVEREAIAARLWQSDAVSVDVVQGINSAMKRIRAALNDDATKPRFIETVVGKGYRFIAEVESVEVESPPLAPLLERKQPESPVAFPAPVPITDEAQSSATAGRGRRWNWTTNWTGTRWIAVLLVLAMGGVLWYTWPTRTKRGMENEAVFRQVTTLVPENHATAAAISANGSLIAYANIDGIFIKAKGGEPTALQAPADFVVDQLAWFADGTKLVANGFSSITYVPAIWTVPVTGGRVNLLRLHARAGVPSPDGMSIAFTTEDRSQIWTMGASGEQARQMVAGAGQDTFPLVFWSADGRRLGFQRRHYSPGRQSPNLPETQVKFDVYYDRSYESVDVTTEKIVARVPEMWMNCAAALSDGRLLFLRWDPPGSAVLQLWEVKTDPVTGAFLESPRQIGSPIDENERLSIGGMTASADGRQILVLRPSYQNAIFVGDFNQSSPKVDNVRRLTFDDHTDFPHAWTPDAKEVIFQSNRNGSWDLFKQQVDKRIPESIVATPLTEVLPQLVPDGHWLLYLARPAGATYAAARLMRVPVEGGTPEEVPLGEPLDEFRCALNLGKRCVLRTTAQGDHYTYYDLDPIRGKGRELARTKWVPEVLGDWDVSPDGTQVAIPNHSTQDARIRVVNLERGGEREIKLEGLTDLKGLVSAPGGNGWFVSLNGTVGNRLLYVWPDGRSRPLGDISGWAVPSPDGRHVAFLNRIISSNAWVIERR
jgi:DNA-binding winged helix-turn-helix (wHTH) protein